MSDKPEVITLCGSTRFNVEYEEVARALTLKGKIVISVCMFGHHEALDMSGDVKKKLDELHLRKIDISDAICIVTKDVAVCNNCGKYNFDPPLSFTHPQFVSGCCHSRLLVHPTYIGESTAREIAYALDHGKRIYSTKKLMSVPISILERLDLEQVFVI